MAIGKVKWFNNAKGYGFVLPDDGGEDLFIHYSAIQMDGYKTLKAGQEIQFEVVEGPKGLHAVNIQDVEEHTSVNGEVSGVSVDFDLDNGSSEELSNGAADTTVSAPGVSSG
jgi:CspA family cold shock protein